ncbi:MAG: DinB family protein [Burkholderiaceae bacterium]
MIFGQNASRYARYKAWANQRTFADVMQLPEREVVCNRDGLFGSIVHTLNHNYVIDAIFKSHLIGQAHGYVARNTKEPPALATLARLQTDIDAWWQQWAEELTEQTANQDVNFEFVDGGNGRMTRGEILMHVVNHNNYHRGFVAEMMYQIPATPSATDLPVFARELA